MFFIFLTKFVSKAYWVYELFDNPSYCYVYKDKREKRDLHCLALLIYMYVADNIDKPFPSCHFIPEKIFRPPESLRWPIARGWLPASSVVHYLTSSSQELLGQSLPNLVCSICRMKRQEIVNFTNPRGGNFGVKIEKLMYFFKKFRHTRCVVMMTKGGSTKIVNFITPGQGFLC